MSVNYAVYILYSEKDKRLYVGCTSNLDERLARHRRGEVGATRFRRPLTLIHSEEFVDKAEAFNRERFLKSLWGAREKKKILREYLGLKHSA
ncbi:GIY-YIG nuclease family protein [Candidatus Kaiserbacteria bacterium]|nr:GIY-YIG nuclease family protein [Candidatus Kaiserbacteria bacterium]